MTNDGKIQIVFLFWLILGVATFPVSTPTYKGRRSQCCIEMRRRTVCHFDPLDLWHLWCSRYSCDSCHSCDLKNGQFSWKWHTVQHGVYYILSYLKATGHGKIPSHHLNDLGGESTLSPNWGQMKHEGNFFCPGGEIKPNQQGRVDDFFNAPELTIKFNFCAYLFIIWITMWYTIDIWQKTKTKNIF
jgi:hypothetical protein